MDFNGDLPRIRNGHDYLFVLIDKFSKMCILVPCKNTNKGQDAISMFFEKIWVHLGIEILDFLVPFSKHFGGRWTLS